MRHSITISVLRTFGSDMEYHFHVHNLLTYGGIKDGKWVYPKGPKRWWEHKNFRDLFRKLFLAGLKEQIAEGLIKVNDIHVLIIKEIEHKSWSYNVTKPAMDSKQIELYLARYINRRAITNSRVQKLKDQVLINYTNYRKTKQGERAPKAIKYLGIFRIKRYFLIYKIVVFFMALQGVGF